VCCEVLQFNPMNAKKNVETKEVVAYQFGKGLKKSVDECLKIVQNLSNVCGAIELTEVYFELHIFTTTDIVDPSVGRSV
jgi:hypothetical protein